MLRPMKTIPTKFLSRYEAESLSARARQGLTVRKDKVGLLSFVSPMGFGGEPTTEPNLDGYWHKVLKLRFDDIDPANCRAAFLEQYQAFTEEQAEEILDFLLEIEAEVDQIWTHCEAGISRSAGAAKYIAYAYGSEFPESYSLYNKHVFTTLVRAHNVRMYEDKPFPGQRFHQE
jgi:predicted protein tyrosine phosphatase